MLGDLQVPVSFSFVSCYDPEENHVWIILVFPGPLSTVPGMWEGADSSGWISNHFNPALRSDFTFLNFLTMLPPCSWETVTIKKSTLPPPLCLSCSEKWFTAKNYPLPYDSGEITEDPLVNLWCGQTQALHIHSFPHWWVVELFVPTDQSRQNACQLDQI